jgi:hypothetical protein
MRHVDLRSLDHPAIDPAQSDADLAPHLRNYTLTKPVHILDQGQEGSCTGHGAAHALMCIAVLFPWITHEIAVKFYEGAKRRDEWAGEDYDGSSVTGVMKYLVDARIILRYKWAFSVIQIAYIVGVMEHAVVAGTDWYTGMFEPDINGFLHATGKVEGGHCYAIGGVHVVRVDTSKPLTLANLDWVRSYFLIPNSWGPDWGENGYAKISFIDMAKLLNGGDFAVMYGEQRTSNEQNVLNTR